MVKSKREAWSKSRRTGLFKGPLVKGWSVAVYDKQMAEVLNRYIRNMNIKKVVEYGAGDGVWTEYLARKYPFKQFWGYEWNRTLLKFARQRCKGLENIKFVEADISKMWHPRCDLFFGFGVIEHFSGHVQVMTNWASTLRKGGICILSVPNLHNVSWLLPRLHLKLSDIKGKNRLITKTYGYEEIWSPKYFRNALLKAGLKILEFWVVDRWHEHELIAVCQK